MFHYITACVSPLSVLNFAEQTIIIKRSLQEARALLRETDPIVVPLAPEAPAADLTTRHGATASHSTVENSRKFSMSMAGRSRAANGATTPSTVCTRRRCSQCFAVRASARSIASRTAEALAPAGRLQRDRGNRTDPEARPRSQPRAPCAR